MSLAEYRRKRQFGLTPEPEPGTATPRGRRSIFVVQLHHASRRHYDFRLQVGDTLKSWAVPKGPSYDPAIKRMAVEVEDHPVDYAAFEGEIPDGEYGAGHVARFDHGVWASDGDVETQLAKGHLRFELFGQKLKGGWHLVRSGKPARQPHWLLIKADDAYAGAVEADDLLGDVGPTSEARGRRAGRDHSSKKPLATVAAAPSSSSRRRRDWSVQASTLHHARKASAPSTPITPQLAQLGQQLPQGDSWLHELKWDGYRLVATVNEGHVRLWSRNGLAWSDRLPEIVEAIEQLRLTSAVLDGELIAGGGARADFNLLQATLSGEKQGLLTYVLFDLLHLDGVDVSNAPLVQRKALLERVLGKVVPSRLGYSSHIGGSAQQALELAVEKDFEGIVSKRGDRPHHAGRSPDWLKSKRVHGDEYAVVGYTPPKGTRSGFGALLLARPAGDGRWVYAGRVGSGFSDSALQEIMGLIGDAGQPRASVRVPENDTDLRAARWFAPRFVVDVTARGHGSSGLLRQASFKALRLDKQPGDLFDTDAGPGSNASPGGRGMMPSRRIRDDSASRSRRRVKADRVDDTDASPLRLTHPERIVFPGEGISKQDVADYYTVVMDWLLPEIKGRPLSVIRCPEGIGAPCFFQKHHTAGLERVGHVRLTEGSGRRADYLVVETARDVMELVQFNALEFHPWGALATHPSRADRMVFDLDPGDDVPWADIRKAAVQVRDRLEALSLRSFLRTSGGKGLHVVVPLNPGCDWSLVKRFAQAFAQALAGSEPDRYVAVATKKLRRGRIFIDYLRNSRGATSVASYSLRARPGAPVAVALGWHELSRLKRSDAYSLRSLPARLHRLKADPWAGIDDIRQSLARWADD